MIVIRLLQATDDILRCFPLMADLRPHLREDEFVSRVRGQQREHGYRLAVLEEDGAVRAVAGFRIAECLAWGRFLYVDDLVTARSVRFRGYGQRLFDWLLAEARREGCEQLHLDSGVQRYEAHGFYLKNRLHITSHHFTRVL
ncbi:MAG: GNAT family N-acetyltransferase [Deltaproteobacteria bacterium]|nr:MAG: GNAT family N-acetyltransferase [Deltaproteobacteria bacterium]